MPFRRVTLVDPAVEWHCFAEIVHPSRGTGLSNHFRLHDVLDPGPRLRVAEVEQRRVKIRILIEEWRTVGILDEIAFCFRLSEKRIVTRLGAEKRVDVDEHSAALAFEVGHEFLPVRIVSFVELPVPPELRANRRDADADPVLDPKPCYGDVGLTRVIELGPHRSSAADDTEDDARMHPVRQRTHSAGIFGIGLDEVEWRLSVENTASHSARPDLDDDPIE